MIKNKKHVIFWLSLFLCYLLYRVYWYGVDGITLHEYVTLLFGTVPLDNERNIMWNIALWMIPQLLLVVSYGDFFEKNVIANQTIIFSRTSDRSEIVIKYSLLLGRKIGLATLFGLTIAVIMGIVFGVSLKEIGIKFWIELLNITGYMILLLLMLNLLSLFINTLYSIIFIFLLQWTQLFLIQKYQILGKYLPVSGMLQETRIGFTTVQSLQMFLYNILFVIAIEWIAIYLFQKKQDLL